MYIDLPTKSLPLTINISNPSLPISLWYKEQERGQDKQTPSGIPLQSEPPLISGTVPGHETTMTQLQLIPKGKTPDAGKARCLITEPLEPGEVLDSPIPTTRVESMAQPAVNHEITVTRPQVVPSLKHNLVSASTGHFWIKNSFYT